MQASMFLWPRPTETQTYINQIHIVVYSERGFMMNFILLFVKCQFNPLPEDKLHIRTQSTYEKRETPMST